MIGHGELETVLAELATKHGVPGAVAGVLEEGDVVVAATGVTNLRSGVQMTPDTVYLLGSITKTWVGTLVMRLVDEGTLELDAPVQAYVPTFRVADDELTRTITIRHLLTHSSGLDAGDYIADLGRDPDSVAAYVDSLADKGRLHDPGRWASYNNAGFVVAGRIVEVVTGLDFETALRKLLFEPLELERTGTTSDHAVLHRAAIGHFPPDVPGRAPRPTPEYMLPYCMGPAGATLVTSVEDVLRFASLHVNDGATASGQQLLKPESTKLMTDQQAPFPAPAGVGFGLTWGRSEVNGNVVLSHGGGSNGGRARLTIVPGQARAVTLFANYSQSDAFLAELQAALLPDVAPAASSATPQRQPLDTDLRPYAGSYAKWGLTVHVEADGDALVLRHESSQAGWGVYSTGDAPIARGRLLDAQTLVTGSGPGQVPSYFVDLDASGRPGYLFMHGRLARRVG